jgi:hypothetical protein
MRLRRLCRLSVPRKNASAEVTQAVRFASMYHNEVAGRRRAADAT